MVLEFMQGKDLFEYMQKRAFKISEDRARDIIIQIAEGLLYLHNYGVMHRDLKLDNIMMTDDSEHAQAKLADFGLSKFIGPGESADDLYVTLGYVAPEVLMKKQYGFSCDMWSLGCIAYALMSGTLPFDHDN
jgi:serine/threonine protein kinase